MEIVQSNGIDRRVATAKHGPLDFRNWLIRETA